MCSDYNYVDKQFHIRFESAQLVPNYLGTNLGMSSLALFKNGLDIFKFRPTTSVV